MRASEGEQAGCASWRVPSRSATQATADAGTNVTECTPHCAAGVSLSSATDVGWDTFQSRSSADLSL